ncbi:CapA family protein [Romboutsia ilealis]|uniref:CapA family protein n=1 Tax=Romboutsia faecis TaxID=2764597 RepID=A0ABR7JMJ1_9FIRM|nr:CapA family protein [Romboutsia faecis]MBC5996105.1 CapA family protein [Romboutsia faecis]MRN23305.1 CapA family protein [Romboutsia ilealis]
MNNRTLIKLKSKLASVLILILVCALSFIGCSDSSDNNNNQSNIINNSYKPTSLSLTAVGDVMAHTPQLKAQYDSSTNTYSFDNNFQYIKSYIENSDLSIANLETTLAGESLPYSSYPTFNTPDALAVALKNSGFDVISTINNHTFDKGTLGFERTLSTLKELGFDTIGTRSNVDDDDYIIKDVNGIKLGITSYSYGDIKGSNKYLNGIQVSDECKDKANIFSSSDIESAFSTINNTLSSLSDTDMQIVILHWGNEYQRTPNNFQKELAQKLSDAGVDIIIGSHPHVVQPVEMIKSSNGENDTLVVYSLGNLISNQREEILGTSYTEDGLMVTIDIAKDNLEDEAYVCNVTCIPTWVNKYTSGSKLVYEIVPLEDKTTLNTMENLPYSKIEQSYENTSSLIDDSDIIQVVSSPFE